MWIADSAATVHTTMHECGMAKKRKATSDDSIMMGNGDNESGSKVCNIGGTICNKYGVELGNATVRDVVLLPNGKFNLFSLTEMMKDGWVLGGDQDSIWLSKGEQKL